MNTLTTILDTDKTTKIRAASMLGMIQSYPNSRSNHLALGIPDIEVYDRPTGASVFVETQDMETYLHIVSVVTRLAAETGYSVEMHQHGWDVEFVITESAYTEPEVETEWVIVHAPGDWLYYYSESATSPHGFEWTPIRERATGFGSRVTAEKYLDAVFPVSRSSYTHVREVEVAK